MIALGSRVSQLLSDQFTASDHPKHAGRREPSPGRSSARGGRAEPCCFHGNQLGLTAGFWRSGKGHTFHPSPARDQLHMGSAAASSCGVNHVPEELLSTQRLHRILYTLHLPFPSDWTVEVFFSGLGFIF